MNYRDALLFNLVGANMTLTTDQVFIKKFFGANYVITKIAAILASGAFGVTCAGGIYTGASKTGNTLVAATMSWANLTAAGKIVLIDDVNNLASFPAINRTDAQTATPFLSLTTGNTGALTASFQIFGLVLD